MKIDCVQAIGRPGIGARIHEVSLGAGYAINGDGSGNMNGTELQTVILECTHSSHSAVGWVKGLAGEGILKEEIARRVEAAWPTLQLELSPFIEWVCTILEQQYPPSDAMARLNIEDLFLAYACSKGDPSALKTFERECAGELRAVAAKLRIADSDRDDVHQKLRDKLFTNNPGCRMRILEYHGSGLLRHWFRVLATRCILDELRESKRRKHRQLHSNDAALSLKVTESDPELASVRRQHQVAFRAAFRTAVRGLEPAERNVLKCHYLMGMSTEQIGKAFGIHKATAARHLARTREKLLRDTRGLVKTSLRANTDELSSVMQLFDEGLSTSLSGLLQ